MKRFEDGYDVDDIIDESWGYDQTNIDFYRIVKRTAKTVWLVRLGSPVVHDGGAGGDKVVAGDAVGEDDWRYVGVIRRKLHFDGDGRAMGTSVLGFGWASTWSGEPVYQTNPMFGH